MIETFKKLCRSELIGQAARFGVVGVANTVVGLGIIYACLFLLGWSDPAANITGYGIGLVQSFALNRGWTFRSRVRVVPAFLRFVVIFAISYGINLALVLALRRADVGPAVAHAAGMPVYTLIFFLLSRWLVFGPVPQSAAAPTFAARRETTPITTHRLDLKQPSAQLMSTTNPLPTPEAGVYGAVVWQLSLAATFFYCLFTLYAVFQTPGWGWDIYGTCPCLTAIQNHDNPYSADYLRRIYQTHLSCTYQPATYYLLYLPCQLLPYGKAASAGLFWIGGTLLLYTRITNVVLFATIMLGAFSGLPFYLLTGNLGASLEMFLICLFIRLFHGRRYLSATATLSAFGFVKLIPLLILLPYIWFLKKEIPTRISRHVLLAGGTLLILLGASALSGWTLVRDHLRLILGGVPGQLSLINEIYFGWSNPTLFLFFRGLADGIPGAILYLLLVVVVLLAIWHVTRTGTASATQKLMFLLLALFLVLPRTKPYFFVSCTPVLFMALADIRSQLQKSILLVIALIYPLVSFNLMLANGLTSPISDVFGGASVFSLGLAVIALYLVNLGTVPFPRSGLDCIRKLRTSYLGRSEYG